MMDEERLDNDLSNRISEVFDNYKDTTADKGWDLLRQKYPPVEKERGLAWLWYAAAAIVLLGLSVWLIQKPGKPDQLMVKQPKPVLKSNPIVKQPLDIGTDTLQNQIRQNNIAGHVPKVKVPVTISGQTNNPGLQLDTLHQPNRSAVLAVTGKPAIKTGVAPVQAGAGNTQVIPVNKAAGTALAVTGNQKTLPAKDSTGKQSSVLAGIASNAKSSTAKNNTIIANPATQNKPADSVQKMAGQFARNQAAAQSSKTADQKAFNSLFEDKNAPALKEDKIGLNGSKKAIFSVYAATYFNYAKGSDNKMNVGAGVTSDFKLSNKLKLSTGLSVGQNTFSYNNSPAQSDNLYFASSAAVATNFSTASLVAAPKSPVAKRYNANLVGLDIPVNLKYQFNPRSDTYVAAGLSSGTFINETYQTVSGTNNSVENTTHTSFNNFDLAKTLNVSFGVGYPLGKSNRLIVEPFLKYPLDGLGSQQLKFGAGGINLKLNFQTSKK